MDEYSTDYSQWITTVSQYKSLDKLQDHIVASKEPSLAYFFAIEYPLHKTYRMRKVILDAGVGGAKQSHKYAYLFALNVAGADVKALRKIVQNAGNTSIITDFACNIPGAEYSLLEKQIIASKKAKFANRLIKTSIAIDVKALKSVIIQSKKPRYLFDLATRTSSPKEIMLLQKLIIESKSFTYMRMFAENIDGADVEKIEQAVLDSGNTEEIEKFAKYVKASKMRKFLVVS
jgi:hypothetical protein